MPLYHQTILENLVQILSLLLRKKHKKLIRVIPTPMKSFQGWRYYLEEDIPRDLNLDEELLDEDNNIY